MITLALGHGFRARYSLGTDVNIPFFTRQDSGTCPVPEYMAKTLGSVHTCCLGGCLSAVSLGTGVNTPFFQEPMPKFGLGAGSRVQGRDLRLREPSHLESGYDASTKVQGQEFL